MNRAYLSLGSNLNDRLTLLTAATKGLEEPSHTRVVAVSSVYETAPQGKTDQPAFLNIAVLVETALAPLALLRHTQALETALGRVRLERWGPRTVDIDIIFFEGVAMETEELTLPHPRAAERAFVMIPLLELDPDLPIGAALKGLPDQGVSLVMTATAFQARVSSL